MFTINKRYTDYNGTEREETLMFNLSPAECVDFEFSTPGSLSSLIETIVKSKDTAESMKLFKEIILKAYGEKSADGKYFHKSKEISEAFSHTEAFSDLYMELITDDEFASEFFNNIMPKNLDAYIKKLEKKEKENKVKEKE